MIDRKKAIQAMRKGGMTYEEIGDVLGVSRQRVHQIENRNEPIGDRAKVHPNSIANIPYPALRDWMTKNRVSVAELSRRCGTKKLKLNGDSQPRWHTMRKILAVTGMTFEECFRRDDDQYLPGIVKQTNGTKMNKED